MESVLATLLVAAAVGYIAAAATALWLVQWSRRTKIVKFFLYIGSAITATGTGFALLLEPFGAFAGYTQMEWAISFVLVQVIGMWAFVVNTVAESIERAMDGRREGVASSEREAEGREDDN